MAEDITMDGQFLNCPKCGDSYLHQQEVSVFSRTEEDGKVTTIQINTEGKPSFNVNPEENPSSRRHGVIINLTCEHCHFNGGIPFSLAIYQHKGQTVLEWLDK